MYNFPFISEDSDLWEYQVTPWGLRPKTRKRPKKRTRHPTLASAITQARKAGVAVTGATVTAGGVALEFGSKTTAQCTG